MQYFSFDQEVGKYNNLAYLTTKCCIRLHKRKCRHLKECGKLFFFPPNAGLLGFLVMPSLTLARTIFLANFVKLNYAYLIGAGGMGGVT